MGSAAIPEKICETAIVDLLLSLCLLYLDRTNTFLSITISSFRESGGLNVTFTKGKYCTKIRKKIKKYQNRYKNATFPSLSTYKVNENKINLNKKFNLQFHEFF